ncbi:MAG: S8 family serine peptidase [Chitinophagaceae bacterium]
MKRFLLFLFLISILTESRAQFTRYLVKLKNKGGSSYTFSSPLAYLSQRAIDRRTKYSIAIDSTDLPVTPAYITQLKNVPNVTILNVSKWLNAVSILTTDANAITTINSLPFVQSVSGLAARTTGTGKTSLDKFEKEDALIQPVVQRTERTSADFFNYGTNAYNEIHLLNGEFLHNIGLRGQGLVISIMDGGFYHYNSLKAFDSANANGQFLSTWDFVNREASVTEDDTHGMQCLSTIAANIPGQFVGKAPKASFHLFRTEDVSGEYLIEEHNWACAAERADSSGSDIISSSLGYTTFDIPGSDHSYAERNGNTAMISIAADLAAKKGLIVFNSVGNIIDASTQFLSAPADGDSVVAVGSVNASGIVAGSSSFGPSGDGQIKPDMAAVGVNTVIQTSSNTIGTASGTSFSCPSMAGLGTCLWQGFPEFNNMKIIRAMQQSGSIAATPNDRIGYGIPNMKLAFASLLTEYATSTATVNSCTVTINWNSKDVDAMKYEIERKAPGEITFTKVGEVNPLPGNILANRNYQFINTLSNIFVGTISYRIKQVIDTAVASFTFVYIDTATVSLSNACLATGSGNIIANDEKVIIQPNPVSGSFVNLIVESSYPVTNMPVSVYNANGLLVLQQKERKATGKKVITLNIDRLSKGKYYIKVYNGQKSMGTAELIKL